MFARTPPLIVNYHQKSLKYYLQHLVHPNLQRFAQDRQHLSPSVKRRLAFAGIALLMLVVEYKDQCVYVPKFDGCVVFSPPVVLIMIVFICHFVDVSYQCTLGVTI